MPPKSPDRDTIARNFNDYPQYQDVEDHVRNAIAFDWKQLEFASPRLRNDVRIITYAVNRNPLSLKFASTRVKNIEDIVIPALGLNGLALQFASPQIRDNADIVKNVLSRNGFALEFASKRLRDDFDIVQTAVRQNGLALEFASKGIQDELDIVIEAIEQNGLAIYFASEQLQNNKDIVDWVREENPEIFNKHPHTPADRNIIIKPPGFDTTLKSVRENGLLLKSAPPILKDDFIIVMYAVRQNGLALEFASKRLKDEFDIVLNAVRQNGLAIYFVSVRLQRDEYINEEAYLQNPDVFNQHPHMVPYKKEISSPPDFSIRHFSDIPPVTQPLFDTLRNTPILFITTHGKITGDIFEVPLDVEKLNAASIGICNIITKPFLKEALKQVVAYPRLGLSNYSEFFKETDEMKREIVSGRYKISSMRYKRYRDDMDGYRIGSITKGERMYDNHYSITGEYEPYDGLIGLNAGINKILLINDGEITDIGKLYLVDKYVNLSTILTDLASKYSKIRIIDFSCKTLDISVGSDDFVQDQGLAYGLHKKQKSKKSKKGKKIKKK